MMFDKAKAKAAQAKLTGKKIVETPKRIKQGVDTKVIAVKKATADLDALSRKFSKRDAKGLLAVMKVAMQALYEMAKYQTGMTDTRPRFTRKVKGCEVKITAAGWVAIDAKNEYNANFLLESFNSEIAEAPKSRLRKKAAAKQAADQEAYNFVPGESALSSNNLALIRMTGGRYQFYLVFEGENPYSDGPRWRNIGQNSAPQIEASKQIVRGDHE